MCSSGRPAITITACRMPPRFSSSASITWATAKRRMPGSLASCPARGSAPMP